MVLRCAIHLEDQPQIYSAGGIVTGFVVLSTTWSDKLYGITVKLASKVEVDWDASRLFNPYRTSRNEDVAFHSDYQIIMNSEGDHSCLANLMSKRTIIITRGVTHRYPFLLKLPKELACSFRGSYGHVSYKLVVFIRKPFREMYIGATKAIQVAPLLDLNDQSVHLQLPVQDECKYNFPRDHVLNQINSSTNVESAQLQQQLQSQIQLDQFISMKIRLPKTAFVPEEPLHFDVEVDNRTNLLLDGVIVHLNANTYFQIEQSLKVDGRTLLRCQGPPVQPTSRELWSHSFQCPNVLPTGLGTGLCHAIDLQYYIQFELRVSDLVQLSSVFKLVVGTVPYVHRTHRRQSYDYFDVPEIQDLRRSSAPPAYDFQMMNRFYDKRDHAETPPPTYEEALSMRLARLKTRNKSPCCLNSDGH